MTNSRTKYLLLFTLLFFTCQNLVAQFTMQQPIAGNYGRDYIIVNYVDWGVGSSIKDHYCLDKTYNGHAGTDYVIKHFSAMDSGVYVLAADSGTVIFTLDGIFDREKVSDTSKGLGNYIGLTHSGSFQTYYGHLKKGSIRVQVGDTVLAGDTIGMVGSSGNSSDPHLHFELWYDSLYYIDPFVGPCGNSSSYWRDTVAYDSSFHTWDIGMLNFKPTLDTLKEGLVLVDTFYAQDSAITWWSLHYGLRAGDSLKVQWFTPSHQLWFEFEVPLFKNWWYYYFWSYILPPKNGPEGIWTSKLFRNNQEVDRQAFYYFHTQDTVQNDTTRVKSPLRLFPSLKVSSEPEIWEISSESPLQYLKLYNLEGKLIWNKTNPEVKQSIPKTNFPRGIYILEYAQPKKRGTVRLENL